MDTNIVVFPLRGRLADVAEVAEMRTWWLKVRDDRKAMQRVAMLAERVADIIDQIDEINVSDRQSLLWHLSLIHDLATPRGITPLCSLPRFRPDPEGAA
jgi:hypothetical protein